MEGFEVLFTGISEWHRDIIPPDIFLPSPSESSSIESLPPPVYLV
jgi:hypothetical protein